MSAAILIVAVVIGAGGAGVTVTPPIYFPDAQACEAARPRAAALVRAELEAGGQAVRAAFGWCLDLGTET